MAWKYILIAVVSYCIGNFNPAIIISRIFHKTDIRTCGSGNAGTTNAFRCFGVPTGMSVMLLDMAKGALSVFLAYRVIFEDGRITAALVGGLFAVIGHIYPVIFGFHGGKGVATVGGMLIMLDYRMFFLMLAVFLIILFTTGFMSLASMSTVVTIPVTSFCLRRFADGYSMPDALKYMLCVWVFGFIIVFTHRENIKRLLKGQESRIIRRRGEREQISTETEHK